MRASLFLALLACRPVAAMQHTKAGALPSPYLRRRVASPICAITKLANEEEYRNVIEATEEDEDKIVVILQSASHCTACKSTATQLSRLAEISWPDAVTCYTLNIDDCDSPKLFKSLGIKSVPHIQVASRGQTIESFAAKAKTAAKMTDDKVRQHAGANLKFKRRWPWRRLRGGLAAPKPITLRDRLGHNVVVRTATAADLPAVRADIADHKGVGSGTGDDEYLISQFEYYCANPQSYTVLFAERPGDDDDDDDHSAAAGLGIITIAWASDSESYWEGLRVAESAKKAGIAALLIEQAAKLCVAKQGPDSVSRWGLVTNNGIMIDWSRRLKLRGPLLFRRHGAQAASGEQDEASALPEGYSSLRPMRSDGSEMAEVLGALPGFLVARTEHGSQNFVRCGWAEFNEAELAKGVAREPLNGVTPPAPLLLRGASGELVGFCSLGKITVPEEGEMVTYLFQKYMDGATPEAVGCLLDALPFVAREEGCAAIGGYVPSTEWMVRLFEMRSLVYARATATEQAVFAWRNEGTFQ